MDGWLLRGEGEGEGMSGAAEVLPKQEDNWWTSGVLATC